LEIIEIPRTKVFKNSWLSRSVPQVRPRVVAIATVG